MSRNPKVKAVAAMQPTTLSRPEAKTFSHARHDICFKRGERTRVFCKDCSVQICPVCKKNFNGKLKDHFERGTPAVCTTCNVSFPSVCGQKAHSQLHGDYQEIYVCPDCGLVLRNLQSFIRHSLDACLHLFRESEFQCILCEDVHYKSFQLYKQHMFNHVEANFQCTHCGSKPMKTEQDIQSHFRNHHKIETACTAFQILFFCQCCQSIVPSEYHYQEHVNKERQGIFYCVCNAAFRSTASFQLHRRDCSNSLTLPPSWENLKRLEEWLQNRKFNRCGNCNNTEFALHGDVTLCMKCLKIFCPTDKTVEFMDTRLWLGAEEVEFEEPDEQKTSTIIYENVPSDHRYCSKIGLTFNLLKLAAEHGRSYFTLGEDTPELQEDVSQEELQTDDIEVELQTDVNEGPPLMSSIPVVDDTPSNGKFSCGCNIFISTKKHLRAHLETAHRQYSLAFYTRSNDHFTKTDELPKNEGIVKKVPEKPHDTLKDDGLPKLAEVPMTANKEQEKINSVERTQPGNLNLCNTKGREELMVQSPDGKNANQPPKLAEVLMTANKEQKEINNVERTKGHNLESSKRQTESLKVTKTNLPGGKKVNEPLKLAKARLTASKEQDKINNVERTQGQDLKYTREKGNEDTNTMTDDGSIVARYHFPPLEMGKNHEEIKSVERTQKWIFNSYVKKGKAEEFTWELLTPEKKQRKEVRSPERSLPENMEKMTVYEPMVDVTNVSELRCEEPLTVSPTASSQFCHNVYEKLPIAAKPRFPKELIMEPLHTINLPKREVKKPKRLLNEVESDLGWYAVGRKPAKVKKKNQEDLETVAASQPEIQLKQTSNNESVPKLLPKLRDKTQRKAMDTVTTVLRTMLKSYEWERENEKKTKDQNEELLEKQESVLVEERVQTEFVPAGNTTATGYWMDRGTDHRDDAYICKKCEKNCYHYIRLRRHLVARHQMTMDQVDSYVFFLRLQTLSQLRNRE